MPEPKWRITIEGEGTLSQAQWATLNSIVDDTRSLHYETFPLLALSGTVGPSDANPSGRWETPDTTLTQHRTGHCEQHGFYGWRSDEQVLKPCPACVEQDDPHHDWTRP